MEPTKKQTPTDPVQAAPAGTDQATQTQTPAPTEAPVEQTAPVASQQKPVQSAAQLEAAHARAHKRLTIIETVGVVLLVFLLLSAAAVYAFYQQESNAADRQPYQTNEYQ